MGTPKLQLHKIPFPKLVHDMDFGELMTSAAGLVPMHEDSPRRKTQKGRKKWRNFMSLSNSMYQYSYKQVILVLAIYTGI